MNPEINQPQVATQTLDEGKLYQYRERLRLEQNLPMAFVGGSAAALVGAILWAAITVTTDHQIGYMAVGVGFLVGYTVRYLGKGLDTIFGIIGAALALIGCLMGNFFSLIGYAANEEGLGYFEAMSSIDYSVVPEVMISSFSPIDLLFYGLAIYEGYRFSFRQISDEEIAESASK